MSDTQKGYIGTALKYCPITRALATVDTTSYARLDSRRHHCIVADRWGLSCQARDRCSVLPWQPACEREWMLQSSSPYHGLIIPNPY